MIDETNDDPLLPATSADWLIRRATETDRSRIARFCSCGVLLVDNRADIRASLDAPREIAQANTCVTWIAEYGDRIVGMISLVRQDASVAYVVELRVDPALRGSHLPVELLKHALRFGRAIGILKLILDPHLIQQEAEMLFGACGYNFSRNRRRDGLEVMEFYLDLYRQPKCEQP